MICAVHEINEMRKVLEYFRSDLPSLRSGAVMIPDFAEKVAQFGNLCVFREDSLLKGFAVYYANDRETLTGYLSMIAVKPSCQNAHIGSRLLAYVEKQATLKGMHTVKLEVSKENLSAISFYEHHGYHRCGEKPQSYYYEKYMEEGR